MFRPDKSSQLSVSAGQSFLLFSFFSALLFNLCFPASLWAAREERADTAMVMQVKEGNILVLKGGQEVRLIGVRGPSIREFTLNETLAHDQGLRPEGMEDAAQQARDFVKYLVEGQTVRLEVDPAHAPIQHRDREGRILAYVWFVSPVYSTPPDWLVVDPDPKTPEDGFLNAAVMRAGYGTLETDWPFSFGGKFLALEQEAKSNQRGMWKLLTNKPKSPAS